MPKTIHLLRWPLLLAAVLIAANSFAGRGDPRKSATRVGRHEIVRQDGNIHIVDRKGERWNITRAVEKYGMRPRHFHYGLGRGAFTPITDPDIRDEPEQGDPEIFGVTRNGVTRAYDVLAVKRHETLMDRIGREPVMVAHCYLADLAGLYEREVDGRTLTLVASGWTYHNGHHDTFVLYDKETDSLWFPFAGDGHFTAVAGPLEGEKLKELGPTIRASFSNWHATHPDTTYAR